MRNLYSLLVLVPCIIGVSSDLPAQAPQTAIQAVFARLVPNKQLPADLTLTGQMRDGAGLTQPFQITIKGKDQFRYDFGSGKELVSTTINRGSGWRQAAGKIEILQQYTIRQRPALVPFLDILAEADAPTLQVADKGVTLIGGGNARRYTLTLPDTAPRGTRLYGRALDEQNDTYVDVSTALVRRTERWLMAENSMDAAISRNDRFFRLSQRSGFCHPIPYRRHRQRSHPSARSVCLRHTHRNRELRSSRRRFCDAGSQAMKRFTIPLCLILLLPICGWSQSSDSSPEGGEKPLGSYFKTDIDSVSLTNGNLHLTIPIFSLPGREVPVALVLDYNSMSYELRYGYMYNGQPVSAYESKQWAKVHETLHKFSGLDDETIKTRLGLSGPGSGMITDEIKQKCN